MVMVEHSNVGGWKMEDGDSIMGFSLEVASLRRKIGSAEVSGEYIFKRGIVQFL